MNTVRALVCVLLLHCIAGNVSAAPINWIGTTSSDLNTAANWNPATVPGTGDQAVFNGGSSENAPTFTATFGGGSGFGGMLVTGGQTSALTISNAGAAGIVGLRLVANAGLQIDAGAGAVTIGGGPAFFWNVGSGTSTLINNSANTATIGSNVSLNTSGGVASNWVFSGTGNWLVDGATTAAVVNVSYTGSGTLTLNGNNAHTGVTTVSSGTLRLGSNTALGSFAAGTVVNAGAALDINARSIQGEAITVAGTITNTGGEQQNALRNVTLSGNATFAGTGRWDIRGPSGTLDLAGFTLTKTGANMVAIVDSTISPGAINVNQGTLSLTRSTWNSGNVTVASGATLRFENNNTPHSYSMGIGLNSATLLTLGGATTVNSAVALTGANTFQVDNNSLTLTGPISGAGSLSKTGAGALVLAGTNSHGATSITAGVLRVTNTAGFGAGTLTLNGGTLELLNNGAGNNGAINYGNNPLLTNSGNTITIHVGNNGANTGNTVRLGGLYNLGNSTLNVTGANGYRLYLPNMYLGGGGVGTAIINPTTADLVIGDLGNANASHTLRLSGTSEGNIIEGAISNAVASITVEKIGSSTWTLSGVNTYSGPTSVTAGKLLVDGSITSPATVSGGTLGGRGTIYGNVDIQAPGAIAAGDSPGHLSIVGTYTQTGNMLAEIGGYGQGTTYDWIDVTGTATLTGARVDISLVNNFHPQSGDVFDVLTATGGVTVSGLTLAWDPAQLAAAQYWTYRVVNIAGGQALRLEVAVPEPATLALAGLAFVGLLGFGWRRRGRRGALAANV